MQGVGKGRKVFDLAGEGGLVSWVCCGLDFFSLSNDSLKLPALLELSSLIMSLQ